MATTKAQRIGIWVIAAFMAVGTIGSFAIIVLANKNEQNDQAKIQALTTQYQKDVAAQAKELSDKYYPTFNEYRSRVAAFDADAVTELGKEDLVVGTGEELKAASSFTAYYIGWTPEGQIFDSSFKSGDQELDAPYTANPGEVIEGWSNGIEGMKVGGIRELTIPASQAYKDKGSGQYIKPNMPIKFVIMTVPTPKAVEVPEELIKYYQSKGY